ncbi:MAG: PEP-CTERM sorting domain-containing protein [Planctomycetota bacterium]
MRFLQKCFRFSVFLAAISTVHFNSKCIGGIIRLDSSPGSLGELLDGIVPTDIGTIAAGPFVVPSLSVAGSPPLSVTITGLTGISPVANATSISFGINSFGGDSAERFDSAFSESLTFVFNESVSVHQLDLRHFSGGEVFEFAGVTVSNDDLSDGRTDVFDFTTPLAIDAYTPIIMRSILGSVGIEAITLEVSPAMDTQPNMTVPEPASVVTFATLGLSCLRLRRRRRSIASMRHPDRDQKDSVPRLPFALRERGCHTFNDSGD